MFHHPTASEVLMDKESYHVNRNALSIIFVQQVHLSFLIHTWKGSWCFVCDQKGVINSVGYVSAVCLKEKECYIKKEMNECCVACRSLSGHHTHWHKDHQQRHYL